MNDLKKNLPIIAGTALVVLLLVAGGAFAYTKFMKKPATEKTTTKEQTTKKKKNDPINTLSINDRPYVTIVPIDSKNVRISVEELKKPATEAEYELEYQAGELLAGVTGKIELGSVPTETKDILFGSCSTGGKCTYHENVKGGTLLLRFTGTENYSLKQAWGYYEGANKKFVLTEKEVDKFKIDSKELLRSPYVIIYSTPGFPGKVEGTPVSDAYAITSVGGAVKGTGKVTITLNEEAADAIVMAWDGQSWKELSTTVEGKTAIATGDLAQVYVVVKK